MAKKSTKTTPPLRFDKKLVLNQWLLSLFEVEHFDALALHLKPLELEGLDENNIHKFLHVINLAPYDSYVLTGPICLSLAIFRSALPA